MHHSCGPLSWVDRRGMASSYEQHQHVHYLSTAWTSDYGQLTRCGRHHRSAQVSSTLILTTFTRKCWAVISFLHSNAPCLTQRVSTRLS